MSSPEANAGPDVEAERYASRPQTYWPLFRPLKQPRRIGPDGELLDATTPGIRLIKVDSPPIGAETSLRALNEKYPPTDTTDPVSQPDSTQPEI